MKSAPALAQSINRFGFSLMERLPSVTADQPNLLVSPASISLNLQTALIGATGSSRDGLMKALELSGESPETIQAGAYGLVYGLLSGDDRSLSIANSVWTIGDAKFTPSYLSAVKSSYAAEALNVPDRSGPSIQRINDWVNVHTRERIAKIIDDLDPMARVFLVNAIAFDGKWKEPFDKNRTRADDFTTVSGKKVRADFMEQSGEFRYSGAGQSQVVQLDYQGGKFSMLLALPSSGTMAGFVKGLADGGWDTLVGQMGSRPGTVRLPKWVFRDSFLLNDPLINLGAGPAFSPSKDWLALSPDLQPEGYIGRVLHKTYVEVDEEGTKAAAVTGTELRKTSARVDEPFKFDANRPFVYAIRHNESGLLLFVGICGDPTAKESRR